MRSTWGGRHRAASQISVRSATRTLTSPTSQSKSPDTSLHSWRMFLLNWCFTSPFITRTSGSYRSRILASLSRIIDIDSRIATIESADGQATIAQQLLVEAPGGDS